MKIIFLHIPKAAGTTFNQVLDREYRNKNIFKLEYKDISKFKNADQYVTDKMDLIRGHMRWC